MTTTTGMGAGATELTDLTAVEALAAMRAGRTSSEELTRAYLDRIERLDKGLVQAYLTVTPELALEGARAADARRAQGEDAPLLGVPMALKDLALTRGVRTTCGSKMLESFVPVEDATIWDKLRAAGAVLLGKLNMDEFAMGSSTENSGFFPTRNPWGDLSRVPGGSSGGSAAAVAGRLATFTIGSDTGGSIRQPASLCGVVGLKPTYGRVSRYGLVAFASSLDQFGPLTIDVADCALVTSVIAGHDPKDSTSLDAPVPRYLDALAAAGPDLRGLRIGVPKEYFVRGMEPGVEAAVRRALDVLRDLGAELGEVSLPHTDYGLAAYYLIAPAECSANLARYDGIKYGLSHRAGSLMESYRATRGQGFGPEVKRRVMLGTHALSSGYHDAYYIKAQKVRTLIKQDFDRAFERVDVIVAPTSPTVAFAIGERGDDPLQMYLADVWTIPANMAGIPGVAVPCGFAHGLPVSIQLFGPAFGEATILRAAHAYEQSTDWHTRRPPLDGAAASAHP
jgi:aspartyl-tRNA(Asn)/glutamyl-tRNA(Gln) amidotransferase subunit A